MRFAIIEGEVYYLPAEEAELRSAMYQLGIDSTWIYTATELGEGDEILDSQPTGVFDA
jgi:hypothetical protein